MLRAVVAVAGLCVVMAVSATAQTTSGQVGSATLQNGYPAGAAALPGVQNSPTGAAAGATTTSTTTTAGRGGGGGGSGGPSASTAPGSAATSRGAGSGGDWVMCPPNGAAGMAPFLTGTDLSCAP